MSKRLSIIIPLYNSAQWLPKCLESVLNQDIPKDDMEIICINDGSPDNSADIARAYQKQYPSAIVVLDQENQGPSGARNNGLRHATGEYLCFVDPDDYVSPNVYGALLCQMEQEQLDMLCYNYYTEDEHYSPIVESKGLVPMDYTSQIMTGHEFIANRLKIHCYIWLYIFRRRIITDNKIWCYTGDYCDDTPWLPQVLLQAERVNCTSLQVQHYIIRSDSLVRTKSDRMIQRKINGHYFLVTTLLKQMESITDKGVLSWYQYMLSHCVISLLYMGSLENPFRLSEILKFIQEKKLLPLSTIKSPKHTRWKLIMVNLCPRLYCWLLRMKNSRNMID